MVCGSNRVLCFNGNVEISDVVIPEGHRPPVEIVGTAYVTNLDAKYAVLGKIIIGTDGVVSGYYAQSYNSGTNVDTAFNTNMLVFASIPWIAI